MKHDMRLFLKSRRVRILFIVILVLLILAYVAKQFLWEKIVPKWVFEEQNLVSNGDIEILDNGQPVGWNTSVISALLNQQKSTAGSPGFQSDNALIMSVADPKIPKKWDTQVRDIKPQTRYTLSFWYRLTEKGVLEVNLFGDRLPVTKMFRYNPMHWGRYSAIVDSDDYSDDCKITFVAKEGIGPFKFWLDKIGLYEGESPIGKNFARLEYQYYNKAYVSPDVVSPLPFVFEWNFTDGKRPPEIQYIVEIPAFMDLMHSLGSREDFGDGSRIDFGGLLEFKEIEHLRPGDIPEDIIDDIVRKRKEYGLRFLFQHTEEQNNPPVNCCIFWMEPYIMMGGYVLPCCQVLMSNKRSFLKKHAFGSVFEKPMKEIWYSERYREFRKAVTNDKAKLPLFCKGCRAFDTRYREEIGIDERL